MLKKFMSSVHPVLFLMCFHIARWIRQFGTHRHRLGSMVYIYPLLVLFSYENNLRKIVPSFTGSLEVNETQSSGTLREYI